MIGPVTLLAYLCIGLVTCVTIPPKITKQSPKDIFYKQGETVKMECEASGSPRPNYYWKRAEVNFSPEGNDDRIVKQKDVGTLIINNPEDKDEGIYQCFAINSQGTAATRKFNLKMAKLDEFKSSNPIIHTPQLGMPLTLNCQSPDSVPDAQIYWAVGEDLQPIFWDKRVTMDYEDRLYFTYVTPEDYQNGQAYHCVAYNSYMRMSVVGPPQIINPQGTTLITTEMRKLWPTSRFDLQGLVGSDFRMKCIFSGNPTPMVKWKRKDGLPFDTTRVLQGNSGGQELVIRNLKFEDAGTYLCDASRDQESTPLEMSVNLNVNSAPTWHVQPKDVVIGENGTAEFECMADGVPKPQIFWFVNGEPLESALKSDKRLDSRLHHLRAEQIVLQNVTKHDTMVFQCNATNIHGNIWAEAFLNVLSEAPTILEHPRSAKVAEGQPFSIPCYVTGKPDPIINWYKNGILVTGGRYLINETGSLFVETAVLSDAGEYRCEAYNTFGRENASATLIVRRKTVIQWKPMDLEVQRGVNAKFTCSGTTDPEETTQLTTTWLKDGEPVDLGTRSFLNIQDLSLTISGSEQRDTGTYTCVVSNGLDKDVASARLVVTDIPDAPYDLKIMEECITNATLQWIAGSFNNAPIEYFIIEHMTKIDPNRWVFANQTDYRKDTVVVMLAPGMDYSFRVTAYNKIGASNPSAPSNTNCVRAPGLPAQNPRNLRTIGDKPGMLHIEWTPVPPEQQGGQNFTYLISIQRVGDPQSSSYPFKITDWKQSELIIPATGPAYTRYKITAKSRNVVGDSTEPASIIYGYSSEGVPLIWPTDLNVEDIQSDRALFTWTFDRNEIGKVDSKIQGEFRGFKVQFWEQSHQVETFREYDVSPEEALTNSTSNTFRTIVPHLIPNSRLQARVAVINNFFVSKPSDVIAFVTPPGLPGPVEFFEDINIGDNHVNLQWRSPLDNRGDVIGYDIGYQEVRGLRLEEMQERLPQIDDPYASTAMLGGLLPNTRYRIYIWARTAAGRGEGFFIERTTASPGVPFIPRFTISKVGTDFINVTWWRDAYQRSGSVIYVEYKKEDGAEWFSTTPDVSRDWVNIGFLQPGMRYNIRIAVTNGETTRLSQIEDVITDGTAKAYDVVANLGWFLGMVFSFLLQIILVVIFVICYRRGFRLGHTDKKIRTYRDGSETYTDQEEIPRVSKEFGPEPGGFSNDMYKEGYNEENDEPDRFDRYDNNQDYNDPEYHDPNYYIYKEGTQSRHKNEVNKFSHARSGDDYEEYNVDGPRDLSYSQSTDSDSYPPPPVEFKSDDEGQDHYHDDVHHEIRRKTTKREEGSRNYTESRHSKARSKRSHLRQTDHAIQDEDYPVRHYQDGRYAEDEQNQGNRYPGRRQQDSRSNSRRRYQEDDRYQDDHYSDDHYDHHRHHTDRGHDHEKCDDVVDEFKRFSATGHHDDESGQNQGHSATFI